MYFLQIDGFEVDPNGMKLSVPEEEREMIRFYLDELDKFAGGYIRWHWHAQMELVLANSAMDVFVQDTQVHLQAGEGMFINAGTMHQFSTPAHANGASAYTIVFPAEYIAGRDSSIYEKCVRPVAENPAMPFVVLRREGWQADMLSGLKQAVQIYGSGMTGSELAVRNAVCAVWLILLRNVGSVRLTAVCHQDWQRSRRLKQMLAFVQAHYMEKISLEQIAAAASVSKSECLNCFREGMDVSPIAYLNGYRLEIARHMLHRSNRSIREIALCCGFDDPAYFSRVFKEKHGVAPKQYRNKK